MELDALAIKLDCIHCKTVRRKPRSLKSLAHGLIPPRNQRSIPENISKSESDPRYNAD
jgi:hypothetical protein